MRAVCPRATRAASTIKNSRYSYHFSTIPTFYYDKGVAVPRVRNLYERRLIYSQVYSISFAGGSKEMFKNGKRKCKAHKACEAIAYWFSH